MKCPVCRTVTFVVEYDGVELDFCPDCRGAWFDRGELDLVFGGETPPHLESTESREAVRPCPICSDAMGKMNIGPAGGVTIDVCPAQCGLWFDRGEVRQLAAGLESDGRALPEKVRTFLAKMFPADEE